MRRLALALTAVTLALAGCGKDAPLRPSDSTSSSRPSHPIAGGVASRVVGTLPEAVTGNPTAPGVVQLAPIGNPIWRPADIHVFSAPCGNAGDGYAEFLTTALGILPPPNHVFNPALGVGPGAPHAGPYTSELASGITNLGFAESHSFGVPQFSNGSGVWTAWMIVADPGVTGSSPDFAAGPIVPNSLFPIHIAGTTYRNNAVWDPFLGTFDVPALNAITPPFAVDGASHTPIFFFDNMDFAPPNTNANGSYTYRWRLTDASGNGWDMSASFTVAGQGGGGGSKKQD
jgi:hypothetical protein